MRYLSSAMYIKENLIDEINNNLISVYVNCSSYLPEWRETDWRRSVSSNKSLGGGVLLELSHEIDLLFFLFGDIHLEWSHIAKTNFLELDVEEQASAVFLTQSNNPIYMDLNFCQKALKRVIEFNTSECLIRCDIIENIVRKHTLKNEEILFQGEPLDHDRKYIDMMVEFHDGDIDYHENLKDAVNTINIIEKIKNNI